MCLSVVQSNGYVCQMVTLSNSWDCFTSLLKVYQLYCNYNSWVKVLTSLKLEHYFRNTVQAESSCYKKFCKYPPSNWEANDLSAKKATTFSILTLSIMTLNIITLSIMTLSIMTLSIKGSFSLSMYDIQHNYTQHNSTWCWLFLCWVSQFIYCYA
jgi:hypothetical protein